LKACDRDLKNSREGSELGELFFNFLYQKVVISSFTAKELEKEVNVLWLQNKMAQKIDILHKTYY